MVGKITFMIITFILAVTNFGGAAKHYDNKKYAAFGLDLMVGMLMTFYFFINYIDVWFV
jgi:hypothetical protein